MTLWFFTNKETGNPSRTHITMRCDHRNYWHGTQNEAAYSGYIPAFFDLIQN